MRVEIYSLQRILFEGDAESVNCKTARGEVTVLDGHEPLISMLEEGPIKVALADDTEKIFAAKGGFLEVNPSHVVRMLVEE